LLVEDASFSNEEKLCEYIMIETEPCIYSTKAVIDDFVAARNDLYTKKEEPPTGKISGTSSIRL